MDITKEIEKVVKDNQSFLKDSSYLQLREFFIEAQRDGIAIKQEYSLPGLDLVGKAFVPESADSSFELK